MCGEGAAQGGHPSTRELGVDEAGRMNWGET
jgi:hypothetical protein